MVRAAIASTLTVSLLALGSVPAAASPADVVGDFITKKEVVPLRTKLVGFAVGYHGDVAAMGELELGYGWGRYHRELLLPKTVLWRASLALRGAYGREDSVATSALFGWGRVGVVGVVVQGGVDLHLAPGDLDLGPIARITGRVGPFGLAATTWVHALGDEADWGWTLGLSFTSGDFKKPITDPGKDKVLDEIKDRVPDPVKPLVD